jgi:transposase-like protein
VRANEQQYTEQFRQDAIAHFRESNESFRQVAFDLGINTWTLREWYHNDAMKRAAKRRPAGAPPAPAAPEHESPEEKLARLEREVSRLERENVRLMMEREVPKKATALIAKQSE